MSREDKLDTFPGLVVGFVLDEIKKDDMAATAWNNQPDDAKAARLDAMIERADQLAQALVRSVEAQGVTRVVGSLEEVQFKKGVKIVVTASKTQEALFELAHNAGGQEVHILVPQLAMNLTAEADDGQQDAFDDAGEPVFVPPSDDDGVEEEGDKDLPMPPGPPVPPPGEIIHPDGYADDDPNRPPREGEPGYIRPPGTIHDREAKKDRITKDPNA